MKSILLQPLICVHSALIANLIKLFYESITPIESGITFSQILQIQNYLDLKNS